jgi:hypothetical protein
MVKMLLRACSLVKFMDVPQLLYRVRLARLCESAIAAAKSEWCR